MSIRLVDPRDISLKSGSRGGGRKSWVSVGDGVLYISRNNGGRSYWMLDKVRPKMHFNDKKLTLRVASNSMKFKSPKKYQSVKRILTRSGRKGGTRKGPRGGPRGGSRKRVARRSRR